MIVHIGGLALLDNGNSSPLICCDYCGNVAVESIARNADWNSWADGQTRYHHCPHCLRLDISHPIYDHWDAVS